MARPVALAALVAAAVLCLLGLVLAFTPLLDGTALAGFETFDHVLVGEFHHGPPPCLRYHREPPSHDEVSAVAEQLVEAGVSHERLGKLVYELLALKDKREAAAHQKDEVEERLDWAARNGAAAKVLVALKRPRLRKVLHRYVDAAVPPHAVAPMTPEERAVFDPLWRDHARVFLIDGVLELTREMQVLETQKKLDALAALVGEKGELDERALPKELMEDAWGSQVKVDVVGNEVQFSSLGADRSLGGSGYDADLSRTATVATAPGTVGPPDDRPELAVFSGGPPPATVTLPRADLDAALVNLNQLANQARIVPSFENGKAVGFKVYGIRKGSLYEKLGLANGDVVTEINGLPLNSPDKALEVYSKIRGSNRIAVSLLRQGKPYLVSVELK